MKKCRGTTSRKRNGFVATGHAPGFFPTIRVDKATGKEKHLLLQDEIRKGEAENNGKMLGLRQQCAWTRWESMVSWNAKTSDVAIKFLIRLIYDTYFSPVNLHLWKKTKSPLESVMQVYWTIKTHFELLPKSASGWTLQMVP